MLSVFISKHWHGQWFENLSAFSRFGWRSLAKKKWSSWSSHDVAVKLSWNCNWTFYSPNWKCTISSYLINSTVIYRNCSVRFVLGLKYAHENAITLIGIVARFPCDRNKYFPTQMTRKINLRNTSLNDLLLLYDVLPLRCNALVALCDTVDSHFYSTLYLIKLQIDFILEF